MGMLNYPGGIEAPFEDRVLAHLEIVITAKLRRDESFAFSWSQGQELGGGRMKIWLHPSVPISYRFHGGRQPAINRDWIEAMMIAASSQSGLQLVPEPAAPRQA
ncbi:ATP-dependent DNA ligase [Rathayibacter sp. VKM Ac-2803]|nr:ATP-dependent DNA ligase [Rathayibacter sp. VKM Ac-2803]MWV58751.1 ATP-dependent DNA ligase [Rathayibacter sp. VKM Ac-2754]